MHAVERDTLALEAYYTLSLVHQHLGDVDEALEAMKKVVYIDRNYILGHFNLANLHHANQNISAAQKSLDNAARLLDKLDDQELIEGSSGTTVGRLRDAIIQSQQVWSMESEMRMNHE